MQNDAGDNVDMYIPRKCSWTNRLLKANDYGSVQINIGKIDPETGVYTKEFQTIALSGYVRTRGEADNAIVELTSSL